MSTQGNTEVKPCLITGGCGFVGRNMTLRQLSMGKEVWVIDDLSTGSDPSEWLPEGYQQQAGQHPSITVFQGPQKLIFLKGDLLRLMAGGLDSDGIQLPKFGDVFHFAAVVGGRATIEGNPMAVAIDLAMDSCMFNWAVRDGNVERMLYPSSSAAYPISMQESEGHVALKESDIEFGGALGQPDMTYGWSKLTGEYLARVAAEHYGLHVACVRPFSGYGEDQDESYPIPAIAARAARKESPITVWGSGLQGRDFVHIQDCIDFMLLVLDKISDGSAANIGSGQLTNFRQVAALFVELAGYETEVKPLVDKPVGVHSRYGDPTFSREVLGWEPKISIREGFARVLAEARKRHGIADEVGA
ncbi:MAG: NAD-dependent epimerase/dehydratase family protein [Planctomycetota bacterium]|nr:MAG: NAD-dependent epimerase/dehydratase family protein [Planctomycetota bacterium]